MDTGTIIWIVVAVVVIALVAGVVMTAMRKRRVEQDRRRATELREKAHAHTGQAEHSDLAAREAEAEAERARAQAEQAEARATEARRDNLHDQAQVENHVREADHLDPDADPGVEPTQSSPRH